MSGQQLVIIGNGMAPGRMLEYLFEAQGDFDVTIFNAEPRVNVALSRTELDWRFIGTIDDIPRQGARCVENNETKIAVFRTADDRIFALEDKCPHKNGPLSQDIVHGGCVTCPLHNWVISLETGTAKGADEGQIAAFPVRLDGRDIYLQLPPGA